ncbi:Lipoprotein [Pararobbsia alpina]|uniref:BufA2 family periplasmic bufferin-type metallophore n=1 Tax=Pararobbsia alpina TaxID=621374 RepID=UPI0039A45B90
MKSIVKSRASFAAAAALLAVASAAMAPAAHAAGSEQPGRCYGVNSCKGQSLCATAKHDCKGLNTCKGQGVVVKTPSACLSAGGTLTEPK